MVRAELFVLICLIVLVRGGEAPKMYKTRKTGI